MHLSSPSANRLPFSIISLTKHRKSSDFRCFYLSIAIYSKDLPKVYFYLQQILFCVTIVRGVSPSCVKETPSSSSWSCVSWHANQFAIAVIDAVNSQAFITSPSIPFYDIVILLRIPLFGCCPNLIYLIDHAHHSLMKIRNFYHYSTYCGAYAIIQ